VTAGIKQKKIFPSTTFKDLQMFKGARKANPNSLTSGQAAKVLNVSPRTLVKWSDSGKLKSWRVNNDRRYHLDDLIVFAKNNNMEQLVFKNQECTYGSDQTKEMIIQDLKDQVKKLTSAFLSVKHAFSDCRYCVSEDCFKIQASSKKIISSKIHEVFTNEQ
jgi:excisionase family DNA binding protein